MSEAIAADAWVFGARLTFIVDAELEDAASEETWKRHPVLGAVLVIACLGVLFAGLQVYLEWEDGCSETPEGYFSQVVMSQERHLFWTACRLDPGNGEPEYVIHRPWQSVHGS